MLNRGPAGRKPGIRSHEASTALPTEARQDCFPSLQTVGRLLPQQHFACPIRYAHHTSRIMYRGAQ